MNICRTEVLRHSRPFALLLNPRIVRDLVPKVGESPLTIGRIGESPLPMIGRIADSQLLANCQTINRDTSHDRVNRRRLVTGESPEPKRRRSSFASSEEDLRSAERTQSVRSSSPPASPPDHYYRDLGILHSRCDQLSLALAESCWGGHSPVIASPRVSPPSDALCHPRPDSSSLKIVIVQETPPAILLIAVAFQGALSRSIRSWRPI